MRYRVLATDYDGTLAEHGRVTAATVAALERWRAAGGRGILVSGRQLEDLQSVFPRLDLFDWAVLENGALLFHPPTGELHFLAEPPPSSLIRRLEERGVPLATGRVIVATLLPHLQTVRESLDELGLPHRLILNLNAVMVLPPGVDKGSGTKSALARLGLPPAQAVGIGDAENDLDLFRACGLAVAVSDAIDEVKQAADLVTVGGAGAGVVELLGKMLSADA